MTTTKTITIDDLEAMAAQIESDEACARAKLARMVRAYARILAVREPDQFQPTAVEISDVDGHYDRSFPPKVIEKDFSGPRLLEIEAYEWDRVATSRGFYHSWRAITSNRGLYVARDGRLWGATVDGTGRVGQFAAHPGDCGVSLTVEWSPLDDDDVSTEALRTVERVMRAKAFPASARSDASVDGG